MKAGTGQPEKERQNRAARMGQSEWGSKKIAYRSRLPRQDCLDRTARTGLPEEDC